MERYQSNLVWIDLEMTGLDPERDTILEIATIVTTNELEIVAEGPTFVIGCDQERLDGMDEWNKTHHGRSGLIDLVKASTITLEYAQEMTLAFLKEHTEERRSPLCGNSVWQDRFFLRNYMAHLNNYLNYRIIDVSSIKEAVKRWYPKNDHAFFAKTESHRAREDIVQSIEELKHYRTFFFHENQ